MGLPQNGMVPPRIEYLMPISYQNDVRKLDESGRLSLGKARAGEQYRVNELDDGTIVLTPMATIPKRELWLWRNQEALTAVKEGLEQSARGEGRFLGDFTQFVDDEDDETAP
ncbi:MAG: hypothetical protein P4L46_16555 [Fimbriimonas sp.]|nr:hypothetical protein [Fimbriimonas sp.]